METWFVDTNAAGADLGQPNRNFLVTKADNLSNFKPIQGSQVTDSENHPAWKRRKTGVYKGDLGGPFMTKIRKAEVASTAPATFSGRNLDGGPPWRWFYAKYTGPILPISPLSMSYPPFANSTLTELEMLGTEAIAECAPTNPTADVTVMLGELLREGIPRVVGDQLRNWRGLSNRQRRKAIGSEYLNVEFGWNPLIRDLKQLSEALLNADRIIAQHYRDSGRMVRRKYGFKPVEKITNTKVVSENTGPWWNPDHGALYKLPYSFQGKVLSQDRVSIKRWFSGAFSYYIPPADSLRNDMAKDVILARKLLGLSLTPDTLWNLAPWSWAIDWISNASETLQNWTSWAIDNLVVLYGYMMEHSTVERTYIYAGPLPIQAKAIVVPSVTLTSEVKWRIEATPYGFGLNYDGFNSRQKAIIAALGLSRS